MKKLILLLLLTTFSMIVFPQNKNAVLFSYYPQDNGIGLRYNRYFENIGIYCSYSHGNYQGKDNYCQEYYINNHNKYAAGASIRASKAETNFLIGLSYHTYGEKQLTSQINPDALMPLSIEFGVSGDINHFTAGFRMDPIKWEGCFEIGFNF